MYFIVFFQVELYIARPEKLQILSYEATFWDFCRQLPSNKERWYYYVVCIDVKYELKTNEAILWYGNGGDIGITDVLCPYLGIKLMPYLLLATTLF